MSAPRVARGGSSLAAAARRPVAVAMVVAAVCVFGVISYQRLDLALLPKLDYPTLTVRTEFPGAGPREVDKRVTDALEKRLATTNGLVSMTSVSRSGLSDITLEFSWDTEMLAARSDVESKIAAAVLPDEVTRPLVLPYDPNLDPILRLAVRAKGKTERDLAVARRLAEEEVEKELKKLKGVAAARIRGGREREIAVHLDESALRRSGIRLADVAGSIEGANRNEAAGLINEGPIEYIVRSVNELRSVAEIEELVVANVAGVPTRIRDLGRVVETWKDREIAAFLDGNEAVLVEVYKRADSNLVAVAARVRDRISGQAAAPEAKSSRNRRGRRRGPPRSGGVAQTKNLSEALAPWVELKVLTDQSRFIEGAIGEVRNTALLGGLLATLVLYLFLRRGLFTMIAAGVIGICVIATFAPLFMAGVSLNIMSLGGLALGVGMLVDNAIVVLEASARKREEGLGPLDAAVGGVRDVAGAITASTITSVCVFFPIVFVEEAGVAGQIFRDLALTVVFALVVSLLVALFVIPTCLATLPRLAERRRRRSRVRMRLPLGELFGDRYVLAWLKLRRRSLARRVLGGLALVPVAPLSIAGRMTVYVLMIVRVLAAVAAWLLSWLAWATIGQLAAGFQWLYSRIEGAYEPFLRGCLRARALVVLLALGALGYAGWRAAELQPDLLPESLTGEFDVKVSFAPGTPLETTAKRMRAIESRVRKLPEVEWVATTVGAEADADRAADEGEHTAHLTVHLRREAVTPETEREVRRAVEAVVARQPNAFPAEFLPSLLFRFAIPLKLVFFGSGEQDLPRLGRAAAETGDALRRLPGIEAVRAGSGRGAREVKLTFDRVQLFRFGLTAEQVATRVREKLQGRIPTSLVEGSARTDIRVRIREEDRATLDDMLRLNVAAEGKSVLPLAAVLEGEPVVVEGPGEIRRVGGRHASIVTADYGGFQLGAIADEAARIAQPLAARHGVEVESAGRSREASQSTRALMLALALAAFLVYAVMAAQFESLGQPILIMASLPLAGVGAVLLLDWLSLPVSVVVLLGAILLVGIAVNNAIVLVDCINQRRRTIARARDAIVAAARERLRPILMTTATTILGLLPLTGALAGVGWLQWIPFGLGGGEAAELRAPMAITVIGGLVTSTLLTLVVVPVLYDVFFARRAAPAEAPAS